MSIAAFVAGVERILTRAHDLYPSSGEGESLPTSGGGSVPASPGGAGGLQVGVTRAAGSYQQARTTAGGLDQELQGAAEQGAAIGTQGRVGSGMILDQARAVAASTQTLGSSPAGARLIMATMDQHLAAMQGQLQATKAQNQAVTATLRETAAGYQTLSNGAKDSPPAVPLDSSGKWKPGDKRHMPYGAGVGGMGPPNYPGSPPWVDIYDRTKDPAEVPHYFVRSDEIPGYRQLPPGALGPPTMADPHGNPDPFIELGPNSGVWVPQSAFPGAKFYPPGSSELPPYGWEEYVPGSGIFVWHGDLIPEPYKPYGPAGPPTIPQGGH
ncbi:hypothetical protein [Mycobacterium avium]|uniref:hypothetical protein n=2 Tax=Mycobacterium avium TaxID=1764 RepID=UPI000B25AA30|nr:hypothetical protein [Mycobacterium avium]MDO2354357.1 hypothetical protein [Mycobacterium avium subsp. hominissuis]